MIPPPVRLIGRGDVTKQATERRSLSWSASEAMNTTATLLAVLMIAVGQTSSEGTSDRLGNFVVTPHLRCSRTGSRARCTGGAGRQKGQVVEEGQILGRVDDSDARSAR